MKVSSDRGLNFKTEHWAAFMSCGCFAGEMLAGLVFFILSVRSHGNLGLWLGAGCAVCLLVDAAGIWAAFHALLKPDYTHRTAVVALSMNLLYLLLMAGIYLVGIRTLI